MTAEQLKNSGIEKEIHFAFSKSGGKGGQHVNKTESKAELYFPINLSKILTEESKFILNEKLSNRINERGELVLSDDSTRSQHTNRERVLNRFYSIIALALKPRKPRKPTKPGKAAKEKRKKAKVHRKKLKESRRTKFD